MRVNIDSDKSWQEQAKTLAEKIWPKVYKITNGMAQAIFSNVISFARSFFSQLSGKRKIIN